MSKKILLVVGTVYQLMYQVVGALPTFHSRTGNKQHTHPKSLTSIFLYYTTHWFHLQKCTKNCQALPTLSLNLSFSRNIFPNHRMMHVYMGQFILSVTATTSPGLLTRNSNSYGSTTSSKHSFTNTVIEHHCRLFTHLRPIFFKRTLWP